MKKSIFSENIQDFPIEILEKILLSMKPKDAIALMQTAKRFRAIDENSSFWHQMLLKHFPSQCSAEKKEDENPDYKLQFMDLYIKHNNTKTYDGVINCDEKMLFDLKNETSNYFATSVKIFNANINQTNPGPYIHLTEEGGSLSSHRLRGGHYARFKLRLQPDFKLNYDEYSSSRYHSKIYYPGQKITLDNVISIAEVLNPDISKPMVKVTLQEMKEFLLKAYKLTSGQFNYKVARNPIVGPIANTMFKSVYKTNKTNADLNEELPVVIQKASDIKTLLLKVHAINHQGIPIKKGLFVQKLDEFFSKLGIVDYSHDDDQTTFLKKCQAAKLISTITLEELSLQKQTTSTMGS